MEGEKGEASHKFANKGLVFVVIFKLHHLKLTHFSAGSAL